MFWFMNDWGCYGRAYEQIAKTLSEHKKIKKVTCILPFKKAPKNQNFFEKKTESKNLEVITPYWQSINKSGIFYRLRQVINKKLTPLKSLRLYLRFKGYSKNNTVLWVFPPHPYLHEVVSAIPHKYIVTQIIDNNAQKDIPLEESKQIVSDYNYFASIAKSVITSSQFNHKIFRKINPNCCMVENGVSANFFFGPSQFPYIVNGARPKLGYVGFISQRTDVTLMKYIAEKCEDCDLMIVGPDEEEMLERSGILTRKNVYHLGSVSQNKIPNILLQFDICLIPHKDTAYSRSMSPLKLYQYLASGRPIVSTRVAGIEQFSHLVSIADTYNNFIETIYETLQCDSISNSADRISAAKNEMWESKVNLMLNHIGI